MKRKIRKLTRNKIKFNISGAILIAILALSFKVVHSLFLFKGIETLLRGVLVFAIFAIFLYLSLMSILRVMEKGYVKFSILVFIKIIYMLILLFVAINVDKIYNKLNNLTSKKTLYTSAIIVKESSSIENTKDIKTKKIGILSSETSIEGHIIPTKYIKSAKLKGKVISYGSYIEMFEGLQDGEVEAIFVPENYKIMFKEIETLTPLFEKTKTIHTITEKVSNTTKKGSVDKPFTILIMGVDSEKENISGSTFNGDALMLLTFNPKTLNATILSIPRDTYVPIACFKGERKNKITHAAWYGENCMIDTIEGFLDVNIDYFLKINFKGVVSLVDALGGVEVDVPYSFCEQDSKRRFGKYTVYVNKGLQTLNGEQALALARNRKNNKHICGVGSDATNDFVRGQSQQLVVTALMEKMKNVRSIDKLYEIMDKISQNMETNMSTGEILSFYNVAKDILSLSKDDSVKDVLTLKRLYLSGYDQYIVDYSQITNQGSRGTLYNFVPYNGSIEDVIEAMHQNLGKIKTTTQKTLTFDINTPYKEVVIGKGIYNEKGISLLPNFRGKSIDEVKSFAAKNGITVEVTNVTRPSNHFIGQVISQTPLAQMDMLYVRKITVEVVNKLESEEVKPVDCYTEENKDDSTCKLPNFVGMNIDTFKNNLSKYKFSVEYVMIEKTDSDYDETKSSKIIEQSITSKNLYDLVGEEIIITYME